MKNVIFIAPPAAGKGTQADKMKERYNMAHISTGDLLREEIAAGSEIGQKAKTIMDQGGLVDDDIVFSLLEKRLQQPDCENGYILDGFPRNIEQAKRFEEVSVQLNKPVDYVIYLEIDRDEAMRRITGRVSCPICGAIYNTYSDKVEVDQTCSKCQQGKLFRRDDDNEETFVKRFDTYLTKTQPLIDYYKEKGILSVVNSGINKDYTFEQVAKIIDKE